MSGVSSADETAIRSVMSSYEATLNASDTQAAIRLYTENGVFMAPNNHSAVGYSWALLFKDDFESLTLIDAGIPGVTLTDDVLLSDYKRKWNFIFQMLPDLPAELTAGKEDAYVSWWFKNKVYKPGAIPLRDVAAYVRAYARKGRMDAAFDYCRKILDDMAFNKSHFAAKLPIRLLAVGGQYAIPNMGESLQPFFENVKSVVIADSGHFVPEEQPAALAAALIPFLKSGS